MRETVLENFMNSGHGEYVVWYSPDQELKESSICTGVLIMLFRWLGE